MRLHETKRNIGFLVVFTVIGSAVAAAEKKVMAKVKAAEKRAREVVEELDKLYLVPDGHWKYLVPVKKLEMGWCIDCHRDGGSARTRTAKV